MKCAAELMMMKTTAILEHQLEEERKDEECRAKQFAIVKNTIDFCENVIAPQLEKQAININVPDICYRFQAVLSNDRLNNTHFCPLKEDTIKYNDGTPSFSAGTEIYDYETFKAYLSNFCFDVQKYPSSYKSYGLGKRPCAILEILAQACNS